jgi:hypothetical protein
MPTPFQPPMSELNAPSASFLAARSSADDALSRASSDRTALAHNRAGRTIEIKRRIGILQKDNGPLIKHR